MILDLKQSKSMVKIKCTACDKIFGMFVDEIKIKYPDGGLMVFCPYCGLMIRIYLN